MAVRYFMPVGDEPANISMETGNKFVADSNRKWLQWSEMIQDIRDRALEATQLYLENRPDYESYNKPDDAAESLSRVRRPVLAQAIDSTIAQQHLASYPSDERFFKGRPRNEMAKDRMDVYEKHTERRLSLVDFMMNSFKNRKNKQLAGASAVWHPFMYKEEKKPVYSFPEVKIGKFGFRLPGKAKKTIKEVRTFEGTGYIPLNFEDWRVEPTVDNFEEANFIWRQWIAVEELKAVEGLENKDQITSYHGVWDESGSNKNTTYEYMGIQRTWENTDSPLCEHALLYEEWGDFYDENGKFYPNHVLIYSNDAVFHYFGPNPYDHQMKPFTVAPYIPVAGTLYGKSLAQDIIPLCHAMDTQLNQGIDIISRVANPTFTYLVGDSALMEFFGDGPVSMVPGEGIPCKQHESLQPRVWDLSGVQIIQGLQQILKEEIRESTGGVSYATGGASEDDPDRTATEASILASGTNTRFQLFIQMYEEGHLKPYLAMCFENDRQFMTVPVFVDDEVKPLMPDTVKMMDLSFDVTGSRSVMNRAKEIQEVDTIIGALPGWIESGLVRPNGDILEANVPEILKRRVALNSSFRDLDNIMETITREEQEEEQVNLGAPPNGSGPLQQIAPGGAPPNLAGAPGLPGVAVA